METIETLVLTVHVMAAIAIIGLVLIQQGKGSDMGSGFGAGASSTVFGSGGAGSFLTRATSVIAIGFFVTSFGLAFFAKERSLQARDLGIPVVIQQVPGIEGLPELQNDGASEVPELERAETEIPGG